MSNSAVGKIKTNEEGMCVYKTFKMIILHNKDSPLNLQIS